MCVFVLCFVCACVFASKGKQVRERELARAGTTASEQASERGSEEGIANHFLGGWILLHVQSERVLVCVYDVEEVYVLSMCVRE